MKINTGNTRGLTRKLDELGRIVLPKEFRKTLKLEEGEKMEIFLLRDGFYIKRSEEK